MGVTIFPTVNDVGGGKVLSEKNMAAMIAALTRQTDCVIDGLTVDLVEGERAVTVAPGVAIISGYVVQLEASCGALVPDGSTWYLYLQLDRDGLGNATGAHIEQTASDEAPVDSVPLALVQEVVGIVHVQDRRPYGWAVHRYGDELHGNYHFRSGGLYLPWLTFSRGGTARPSAWTFGRTADDLHIAISSVEGFPAQPQFLFSSATEGATLDIWHDGQWCEVMHTGNSGFAWVDAGAREVYAVPGSRLILQPGTEWVELWAVRVPYGGQYQLSIEYEGVTHSGGDLDFRLSTVGEGEVLWNTTLPASRTSSGRKSAPVMVPGGRLIVSARTQLVAAYIYPPTLYCSGYAAPAFSSEEVQ